MGNITKLTDSVGNNTTYTYDWADRVLTDTNQLGQTRSHTYDAVGNKTQVVDRNGRKTTYRYDKLNRQVLEKWVDGNNRSVKTFTYTYDAVGHLLTSTDRNSKYTYTYDAVDRITSIDNTGTAGVPAVKFNYGYDAVGNLLTVNDTINGVSAGVTAYSYDRLNRVTTLTQSGNGVQNKRVDMAYNALNQLTNLNRFSNNNAVAQTEYIYDNNQRLIKLSHKKGSNTIASYDYGYDAANKLAQTVSSTDGTSNFSYDATNQLTGVDNSTQVDEAYSYDANGNRTNNGYSTGDNNQLLSDGKYNYTYDGEGNRTKRTEISTGKVTEYNWDYRNRLNSVVFKDAAGVVTKTIEYTYDVNDQRIGKKIDTSTALGASGVVTERYVIDRNQIALVFDGAGSQTHRYLYGTQIDQVLADETPTNMVWALADHQGTVRDLIDNAGNVVRHVNYDSFGQVVSVDAIDPQYSSFDFRYGYTGREQDAETGLDYYRARYYDAGVGRFISEDPIGFAAGDTNIYRYVGNSPVNGTDPSGLEAELNIPQVVLDGILGVLGLILNPPTFQIEPLNTPQQESEKLRDIIKNNASSSGECPIPDPQDPCNRKPLNPKSDLTQEFLKDLIQEAVNTKFDEIEREQRRLDRNIEEFKRNKPGEEIPDSLKKNYALQRNVAVGIHELPNGSKQVVVTTSAKLTKDQVNYLRSKGYVVPTPKQVAGDLLRDERGNPVLDKDGKTQKDNGTGGLHAEGRQKQYSINNGTKLKAIGVSKNLCESCAKDIKGAKTANTILKNYKNLPKARPFEPKRRKIPGDKKC